VIVLVFHGGKKYVEQRTACNVLLDEKASIKGFGVAAVNQTSLALFACVSCLTGRQICF
jgi:hypothetical protein